MQLHVYVCIKNNNCHTVIITQQLPVRGTLLHCVCVCKIYATSVYTASHLWCISKLSLLLGIYTCASVHFVIYTNQYVQADTCVYRGVDLYQVLID